MAVRTPRAGLPARPRLLTPVLVVVALLLVLGGVGVSLYTDYLWFGDVGYTEVFSTVLTTRILLFIGFGLLMALVVGANITVAYRVRPPFRPMSLEQQNLERYRVGIEPYLVPLLLLVSGVFGLFAGLSASSRWQTWLLWRNRTDFGVADPQFGRDVSYFAMTYPFQRFVLGFLLTAVVLSLIAAAVTHYLFSGLRLQTAGEKVSPAARAHLSVLVGVIVLLKAVAYYLDRFGLAFSTRGRVQGASYTDVTSVLPAKNILIGVAILCALLFFANIVVRNILLPAGALALLVLSAVVLGGLFPAYTQQFRVKPNELQREAPYIGRNIQATRDAYGISGAVVTPYGESPPPVTAAVAADAQPNARLLDPNRLSATFEQLQRLRQYFGVTGSLDIDRYEVDGRGEDFIVAAREVDQNGLSDGQRNWVNQRLTYTHGNGLIAARADQVDANGRPIFESPGIGGGSDDGPIRLDQPRIYFGEQSPSYSVVNTDTAEIDGPPAGQAEGGDAQATFSYDGDGGVDLSGPLRKVAYALKFREPNLVLSGAINSDSKIMYTREPRERVRKVAPFLELDQDPYPAAVGGSIKWIVDGYTTSNGYPYAQSTVFGDVVQDSQTGRQQPRNQVNYIRNSVKATVDAYSGEVALYKFGPRDAVLETWDKAFPGVLRDESEISPELRSHLRYPEDLFKVQRERLGQYHVTDPTTFYSGEAAWGVPDDPAEALNDQVANQEGAAPVGPQPTGVPIGASTDGPAQPPFYSLLQFPGDEDPRFRLSTSFVFARRPNLAAFASVSSDPADYGTIRILQLPPGSPPNGPSQVANQFITDSAVAEELFRFRRNNADVNFGNLLTLPLSGGLLYVQPVFVQAQGGQGFPTLQQVLVAYGDDVAAAPTLSAALQELLGQAGGGTVPAAPTPTTPGGTPSSAPTPPADLAAAITQADQAFRDAQAAFGRGDFAGYAQAQQRLQQALQRLTELQGGAAPAPSASPTG